jgi:tRNA 2-thiocytidine biosynthesis protein TtcA
MSRERETLAGKIARAMGNAIKDWSLIDDGDRILVGVSGGKDSYTLLQMLRRFQKRAPVRFETIALHLDQGHPGFDSGRIAAYLEKEGFDYRIVRRDTYSQVLERLDVGAGETPCSLCSRFRRGILYRQAQELGCNKLALGHHRDDAIETLLLNMFFSGRIGGMPARLVTEDGSLTVIRPLIYAAEDDIREFAALCDFPIEPCRLCSGTERDQIAAILDDISKRNPKIRGNLLSALKHVVSSHLLDKRLLDAGDPILKG